MTALLSKCIAPRRRMLGNARRVTFCVSLAITGLMASAISWAPIPGASACAVTSTATSVCQNVSTSASSASLITLEAGSDVVERYTVPNVPTVATQGLTAVHATMKIVTKTTTTTGTSSSGSGNGSAGATATGGLPCQQSYMFVATISEWTVPPGCYATIYYPDRSVYHANSTFGYCNWWVEALHPNQPDILYGSEYTRTSTAIAGAAVWFDPGVQGAGSAGHWAQAVAVSPNGYWVLITEMNFAWRGGGFGRVDFRYIHVGPGVVFVH